MSSTNRGAVRSPNDYYLTDPKEIVRFIRYWRKTDPDAENFWSQPRKILDPSAGGLTEQVTIPQKGVLRPPLYFMPCEMSYPEAINAGAGRWADTVHQVHTMDIRENSRAEIKADFLVYGVAGLPMDYDMVITNPPFSRAVEFIRKALMAVRDGGYVVMLLRLNFFGSEDRNHFFLSGKMPARAYVHAKRLGFTPDGKTDSIEYMHAIWRKSDKACHETKLMVLPY